MHVEMRLTLEIAEPRQIGERRIEKMPCGRRDEGERIPARELRVGARRLDGRVVERQRVDALLVQPLAVELAFARGRRKPARGEGGEALRHLELLPAGVLERVPFDALHALLGRGERGTAEV